MKAAPVLRALGKWRRSASDLGSYRPALRRESVGCFLFSARACRTPDVNLEVGSGSHAWQTAEVMKRLEPVVLECKPDLVLVYGDVNSTVAAALVCSKLLVPVAHVEAGLRSFDRHMPEEINRIVTDRLAGLLFTPSEDGDINLRREGVPAERVYRVGNVMIDSLVQLLPAALRVFRKWLAGKVRARHLASTFECRRQYSLAGNSKSASGSERAVESGFPGASADPPAYCAIRNQS